jgi:hypothetical protein
VSAPTPLSILTDLLKDERQAGAILQALKEAGWVCAPLVPSERMLEAGWADAHEEDAAGVWREMIRASQDDD